jgi:hypothetical protein
MQIMLATSLFPNALTALTVAAMSMVAWLLRLSGLVSFISETILLGFKAGAALTIGMTQLPKLFGVRGGGDHFFERVCYGFHGLSHAYCARRAYQMFAASRYVICHLGHGCSASAVHLRSMRGHHNGIHVPGWLDDGDTERFARPKHRVARPTTPRPERGTSRYGSKS